MDKLPDLSGLVLVFTIYPEIAEVNCQGHHPLGSWQIQLADKSLESPLCRHLTPPRIGVTSTFQTLALPAPDCALAPGPVAFEYHCLDPVFSGISAVTFGSDLQG
jgi:hypothetical protein